MDRNIQFSVIIPVYNGEKFVSRAIESVLAQTAKGVELILVNDGSTDNSGAICDAYAQKNGMVCVVHKKNGGISAARNAGIAAAQGEYLLFLDADDYLDSETCEMIATVVDSCRPDCLDFGWKYVSSGGEITHNLHKLPKNVLLDRDFIKDVILPPLLNLRNDPEHFIYDFSCTKVFRRDIIQSHHLTFDENRRIWEDRPFVVQYLKHCKSFYSLERCFYNYVDMPGSLSRRYSMEFFRIIIENFQLYRNLFGEEYDFDAEYVHNYWSRSIENMIFRSLEQKQNREQIRQNILDTLQNEQVIHWFAKRQPVDDFEREMSRCVTTEEFQKALQGYETRVKVRTLRRHLSKWISRAKQIVKKLMGR